jgi:hypothetical protein
MAAKLIIGCGYLGRRVTALWCAHNHRVFATTRSTARAGEWRALGLQSILCDVLDAASLRSLPPVESIAVINRVGHVACCQRTPKFGALGDTGRSKNRKSQPLFGLQTSPPLPRNATVALKILCY